MKSRICEVGNTFEAIKSEKLPKPNKKYPAKKRYIENENTFKVVSEKKTKGN